MCKKAARSFHRSDLLVKPLKDEYFVSDLYRRQVQLNEENNVPHILFFVDEI